MDFLAFQSVNSTQSCLPSLTSFWTCRISEIELDQWLMILPDLTLQDLTREGMLTSLLLRRPTTCNNLHKEEPMRLLTQSRRDTHQWKLQQRASLKLQPHQTTQLNRIVRQKKKRQKRSERNFLHYVPLVII